MNEASSARVKYQYTLSYRIVIVHIAPLVMLIQLPSPWTVQSHNPRHQVRLTYWQDRSKSEMYINILLDTVLANPVKAKTS